ncbi:MAG: homoserine kinase [Renibacterium sp.]|nr:homoserine kinase [Renibacterium sp.]
MSQKRPLLAAGQSVTVHVPATSANLGPGFDSLGLALRLHDTLTVQTLASDELEFVLGGEGADSLPRDASHLTVRTIDAALAKLGFDRAGLRIEADNVIPHGRGLGSSAAAIVAALLAATALLPEAERPDSDWVFQFASELEGHPDNVAPALFGGLAVSWHDDAGYRSAKLAVDPSIRPVIAVPETELSTETARAMLPSSISHQSAAANSGRTALLVHAMTAAPEYLFAGTEDYLHQEYRAQAMASSAQLLELWRGAGLAAVISGAGPTVLVLAEGPDQVEKSRQLAADAAWRVQELEIDIEGAKMILHRQS